MRRMFLILSLFGFLLAAPTTTMQAQAEDDNTTTIVDDENATSAESEGDFMNVIRRYYIEGGVVFMTLVLVCFIIGLALCIERIITLNLAQSDSRKLLDQVDSALQSGSVDKAKDICRSTPGPIASIMFEGLDRHEEGASIVEKSMINFGSVQMGLLEKGLVWISLFISLAPMLGFLGTVIGMIQAFNSIEQAGDISPQIVAGGIKVALLTTAFGLIVAVILQVFYNYLVAKIDNIVGDMENTSIDFMDLMVRRNLINTKS